MKYYKPTRDFAKMCNGGLNLSSPVNYVYGVENKDIADLNKLGIHNVWDLLTFYPVISIDFKNPLYLNPSRKNGHKKAKKKQVNT